MLQKKKVNIEVLKLLFFTFIIATIGGLISSFIQLPIPWMLGPMLAVFIGSNMGLKLYLPVGIRDMALMIVGYSIGLSFTKEAMSVVALHLPSIFIMTVLIILFCFGMAFFISKIFRLDYPSVLIGSIPGGLSQMILLSEEIKDINISIVTFFQVSRLMMIVIFIPILVFSPFTENNQSGLSSSSHHLATSLIDFFPNILVFIPVVILSSFLAKKLRFPTPVLVGPIFGVAVLGLFGFVGPTLPLSIMDVSQCILGVYVGLLFKLDKVENKLKMAGLAVISGVLLLLGSWGLSFILTQEKHISPATSILSLAPGGMDQMGIIASEIHADLSIVGGYQLFRLFFIYFVIPPFLRMFIHHLKEKKRAASSDLEC